MSNKQLQVPEQAGATPITVMVDGDTSTPAPVPAMVTPTQMRKPWRATIRTGFQAFVALCVLFPILVQTSGLDPDSIPWLGGAVLVAAAVSRIMALPQLEVFLRRFLPFLSASGRQ